MEFICIAKTTKLDVLEVNKKYKDVLSITHKAKFNNLLVVEAYSKEALESTGLFLEVEKSKKFKLANVDTNFQVKTEIDKRYLKSTQSLGWQVSVGIIDSGIKKGDCAKLIETIDLTEYKNSLGNTHGTIVGKIIEGFAPGALLTSIKVAHFGEDITSGRIIKSIDIAVDLDINILNISLELLMDDDYGNECLGNCKVCDYVNTAVEATDMIIVSSAGNQGEDEGISIGCPGRAEKAITVGATNEENKLSSTSSKGDQTFLKPNILAPGFVKVISDQYYKIASGTSFAAPVVTGILAAVYHTLGKDDAINYMYQTCIDLGYTKYEQGFGLIDLKKFTEVAFNEGISSSSARQR